MKEKKINVEQRIHQKGEFRRLLIELTAETPRSVAIVGCAYLDDLLNEILKKVMIEDKNLFKDFIDRLTFERRINMCYLLGLIRREEMDDLNIIRRIRNDFAHIKNLNSFDAKGISTYCDKLNHLKEEWNDIVKPVNPRESYQWAISLYYVKLDVIRKTCKRIDRRTLFNIPKEPF